MSVDLLDVNFDGDFEDFGNVEVNKEPPLLTNATNSNNLRPIFRGPARSITDTTPSQITKSVEISGRRCIENSTIMRNSSEPDNRNVLKRDTPMSTVLKQCVRRKFPGPAGILPDKPPRSFDDPGLAIIKNDDEPERKKSEPILCSQASENTFSEPPFKRLKKDFDIDRRDCPLSDFTVEWLRKKAVSTGLKGRKIPFLAVVLQNVDQSSADPVLSLRDPTGELFGTVHRDAWREMGENLKPGSAIVLKQVGVFSTGNSRRKILLNITKNNIVTVYSPNEDGSVTVNPVHPTTIADFVKSIADWHAQARHSPARSMEALSSPRNNQDLFLSVTSGGTSDAARMKLINSAGVNGQFKATATLSKGSHQVQNPTSSFDCFLSDKELDELEMAVKGQPDPGNKSNLDSFFEGDDQFEDALVSQVDEVCNNHLVSGAEPSAFRRPECRTSTPTIPKNSRSIQSSPNGLPPRKLSGCRFEICSQTALSDAESSQIDDVLSGVDLDEFE